MLAMTSWIKSVLYKFFVCVCVCIAMVVARMDLANKAMLYTLRVPPPGVKKTPYNVYPTFFNLVPDFCFCPPDLLI